MERTIFFKNSVGTKDLREFVKTIPKDSFVTDIVIDRSLFGGTFIGLGEDIPKTITQVPVDLWVEGDIGMFNVPSTLKVDGDLYCAGHIFANNILVSRDFFCRGNMSITSVEVGGDIICEGNIETNSETKGKGKSKAIKALGNFVCYGNCEANVFVKGAFICKGKFTGKVIKI